MQPADKIPCEVCSVLGLHSPKNLNPVEDAFLQPLDVHSWFFFLCFFFLLFLIGTAEAKQNTKSVSVANRRNEL